MNTYYLSRYYNLEHINIKKNLLLQDGSMLKIKVPNLRYIRIYVPNLKTKFNCVDSIQPHIIIATTLKIRL